MLKKIISIMLALAVCFTAMISFGATALAAANGTGAYTVTIKSGDSLNFRAKASKDSKVLDCIDNGTVINVTKVDGDWGFISINGRSGWVNLDYCTKKSSSTASTTKKSSAATTTTKASNSSGHKVAISSNYADPKNNKSILNRLNELRKKFPNGYYWNSMDGSTDKDAYSTTPCPSTGSHHSNTSHCIGQCDGFAKKLGEDLFGTYPTKWNTTKYNINTVCVGDIIRYNGKHTIMVVGFTKNTNELIIADCNWNCNCNIRWDASFSTSRYFNTVNWVLHYPGNGLTRSAYLEMNGGSGATIASTTVTTTTPAPTTTTAATEVMDRSLSTETTVTTETTAATTAASDAVVSEINGITVNRLGSTDRISTANLIANTGWKNGAKNVVIANAYSFADAQAGVPLADALGAPVLLTAGDSLESIVIAQLSILSAENVYILGGEKVVSRDIEDQLRNKGYNITRIAGANRYATSARIAEQLHKLTGDYSEQIYFVNGQSFPDIMAVSSAAAAMASPILYIAADGSIDDSVTAYMESCRKVNAIVVGDEELVSGDIEKNLSSCGAVTSIRRIGGKDRYETSVMVCLDAYEHFNKGGIFLTTGRDFPDSLAGGAYAATLGYPVILVNGFNPPEKLADLYDKLDITSVYILGGTTAVPDETAKAFIQK